MADIVCHFICIQSLCQIETSDNKKSPWGHKPLLWRRFLTATVLPVDQQERYDIGHSP
jgi:hypothetical protein